MVVLWSIIVHWQHRHRDVRLHRNLENTVDHDIHGVTKPRKIVDDSAQQRLGAGPAHARQNYEAGMDVLHGNERSKVACILCHQDEIVINTSGQHFVIRCAQPAEVAWMQNDVNALVVQRLCDSRGQTLVQKQLHGVGTTLSSAQLRQGLPEGRPRSGCALA